jgi:2'-5' RNA ligase
VPPPNWFVALPLDARQLPTGELDALPPGTRGFHPLDLHVTVAFLGPVGHETALDAWSTADWSSEPALRAFTGPRATFGSPRRPSAYGLELEDAAGNLQAFIARWRDHLLAAADRPADTRAVRPHVTLGRPPRRRGDTIRLRAWLAASPGPAPVTLDRIALYTRADPGDDRRFVVHRECGLAREPNSSGDESE